MNENKISMVTEDGTKQEFYVIEETKFGDVNYILVSDQPEDVEEADAFILKDVSPKDAEEAVYEFVEDEVEFDAVGDIFAELLDEEADII